MSRPEQQVIDLSFIIFSGGEACGLCLLSAVIKEGQHYLTSYVQPIHAPIFLSSATKKLIKRCCSLLINSLFDITRSNLSMPLTIQQGPIGMRKDVFCSEWHHQALNIGASCNLQYDMYVDLKQSLKEIKSFYRKSYKPLINKGLREWKLEILSSETINRSTWEEFRLLHKEVAGKVTRSIESWNIQYEMIEQGSAFMVSSRDIESSKLIGGGLFQYTKHEGIYSVAAYDRSLFDNAIAHPVQHLAIEHMKSLGLIWYRIGEKLYPQSNPSPTQKEIDISKFKEGFCSKIIPRMILEIN